MIILDTNCLIYFLQGEVAAVKRFETWRQEGQVLAISILTKIELLAYPKITDEEIARINLLLTDFKIIILDELVAEKSAKIKRDYGLLLSDCIIAATAMAAGCPLHTRNTKHFQKLKELEVVPF